MSSLIYDLPNAAYHSGEGTYSSSQLKTILEDPELFKKKYITHEIPREELSVFDIGTYFHTAVLEPNILEKECAVFEGIRRGKAWEDFKATNDGKTIITKTEYAVASDLVHAVHSSPVAMKFVNKAKPEVSAFITLGVHNGEIYFEGRRLDIFKGWVKDEFASTSGYPVSVKCRADSLGDSYIADLKSTSGNVKNEFEMRAKVSRYSYDLSAAMYLDVFSAAQNFKPMETFAWIFASKDYKNCKTYLASLENTQIGRAKWRKAVILIAEYEAKKWEIEDKLGILSPSYYEKEWLDIKEEDEL